MAIVEEKEKELLFVTNGKQSKALSSGAVFIRKDFFSKGSEGHFVVSDKEGMTDKKRSDLLAEFGKEVFEAKQRDIALDDEWRKVLSSGDNLDALRLAKTEGKGLPLSDEVLALMFKKWRTDDPNEYRLNWKYLCDYLPEFGDRFGKQAFLSICNRYALTGDMRTAIEQKKDQMKAYEPEYLHFCYSHREEAKKTDANEEVEENEGSMEVEQ